MTMDRAVTFTPEQQLAIDDLLQRRLERDRRRHRRELAARQAEVEVLRRELEIARRQLAEADSSGVLRRWLGRRNA